MRTSTHNPNKSSGRGGTARIFTARKAGLTGGLRRETVYGVLWAEVHS